MEITHCPHCHERIIPPRKPDGCVCDAWEWRDPDNIPPPCAEYCGDGTRNCDKCEHDKECHLPANAKLSGATQRGASSEQSERG